ncbi:hypothetical protein Q7P37_011522 [Cladosporium fusiforme]
MAEQIPNGDVPTSTDVEMKEESGPETTLSTVQPTLSDPTPPPQTTEGAAPQAMSADHLSAAQEPAAPVTVPAAATPSANTPRPSSIPPPSAARLDKPVAHGGSTRQFMNQNVTPHLLEGMKYLAVYEPEKPLLWLSEFLKERSKEVEGS